MTSLAGNLKLVLIFLPSLLSCTDILLFLSTYKSPFRPSFIIFVSKRVRFKPALISNGASKSLMFPFLKFSLASRALMPSVVLHATYHARSITLETFCISGITPLDSKLFIKSITSRFVTSISIALIARRVMTGP